MCGAHSALGVGLACSLLTSSQSIIKAHGIILCMVALCRQTLECYGLAGGPKRRKVMRTSINDKGEEVSEEVWEDTQPASASQEAADGSVAAKPQDSPAGSPVKASEDDALKEQPGQGIQPASSCLAAPSPTCVVHTPATALHDAFNLHAVSCAAACQMSWQLGTQHAPVLHVQHMTSMHDATPGTLTSTSIRHHARWLCIACYSDPACTAALIDHSSISDRLREAC